MLEESYSEAQETTPVASQDENQDSKETMTMTFSKTLKNLKNEEEDTE